MEKKDIIDFYNSTAKEREKWNRRNSYYHKLLKRYFKFIVPPGRRVVEMGCGSGDLLAALEPCFGVGVDFAAEALAIGGEKHPKISFVEADAEDDDMIGNFDYIVLSDLTTCLMDAQAAIRRLKPLCRPHTRVVISQYNYLWEPVIKLLQWLRLKQKAPAANWFSMADTRALLELEGFKVIREDRKMIMPVFVPLISAFCNRFLVNLPFFRHLGLVNIIVARMLPKSERYLSVSIIIPVKNEEGNVENAILRTPEFGAKQEFIYVDGRSTDNTLSEALRVQLKHQERNVKVIQQTGWGKGNAVREGFGVASGDILMILDADMTTPPEDLPKFYRAICEGRGELINGCRLVYPMEKNAMRFLNLVANKFFGHLFSYLLGQRVKDTLCGTKALTRRNYETIRDNRGYFGDFDPFGDFDLLFGAAKQNFDIVDVIVRYRDREYGVSQISRFKHGWLLLKMCCFAIRKIKFTK
ncbi:MAG: glycosyltransferase [Tannerellaceae bacterium]|jgi:SAM-dependent methyltransferase|nr:glycosyltransferase [Tannerellaceae bacterium]